MPGRSIFTPAVLLRTVDYGESDRIVTLLTRERGQVGLLARGARRSKRRFGGALEPFLVLDAELSPGRGELGRLVTARVKRAFPVVLSDLARMNAAGAALELIRMLAPAHAADVDLFDLVLEWFDALSDTRHAPRQLLLCFKVRAMTIGGFSPRFDVCGLCGKRPAPSQAAMFDAGRGHLVCRACGGAGHRLDAGTRAHLLASVSGAWAAGALEPWTPAQLAAAGDAVDAFIERASMGA